MTSEKYFFENNKEMKIKIRGSCRELCSYRNQGKFRDYLLQNINIISNEIETKRLMYSLWEF